MEAQWAALIGLRIGGVAVNRRTENQIIAGNHRVVKVDTVPIENVFGAQRNELAQQGKTGAGRFTVEEGRGRFVTAWRPEICAKGKKRHEAVNAAQADRKMISGTHRHAAEFDDFR